MPRKNIQFTPDRENAFLRNGGVPLMFINSKLTDFPEVYRTFKGESLFISGGSGCGKTRLAVAFMREQLSEVTYEVSEGVQPRLIKNTVPIFISVPNLFFKIKQAYSGGEETEADIINKYTEVNFLILDDFGAEKASDWSLQILYIIIDRRYGELKKTIITSNLSLDELAARLDDRITSRIAGMCEIVKLTGKDRRLIK
jgi:DNA replication protein DnaC